MAYAQIFMEKLKQLIYCNDIPLFNDPSVTRERPQFHLLYKELGSLIQTLFIEEDRDVEFFEKVRILQKRLKAAAEEAEDIVDIFLSTVHFRNNGFFPRSDVFHPSLHLEVVKRSIDSIKMECTTISFQNMKMDSSQRADRLQIQSAGASEGTSDTRNSLRSKKVVEEIIVGCDRDIELIRDKLVEDQEGLDVVSIVGMGGIGKTTLATKVFTDPFVVHHFYIRAWVTVSQTYEKRDLLLQILLSMGVQQDLEKENESCLSYKLNKLLYQKRYLIVIDDIWSIDAWDQLKLIFKDHQSGSRILITTRLTEVASHVKQDGFTHQLQHLAKEQSWELLCGKVFQGDECPEWLFEPGMQIAENCRGLPLSLVVIAGVLANEARSKDSWEKFACSVRSYITGGQMGCMETLALSYHHLPLHLRECLLYLGGFQEDSWMHVERLIWFWMAEGFIQEDGIRSLQEIAESYVMDLVDRNLLIVGEWKFNGDVKVCKVHDLVRELCMEKAKEERFFLRIDGSSPFDLPDRGLKTLVLSFHRLPEHVKFCFVYLGRFRENNWIFVQNLIALWIYEGYIEEDGDRSLEEIAEGYRMDLVQKDLLKVATADHEYKDDDRVCKVPDLAWKLFDGKEMEARLRSPRKDQSPAEVITTYKQRRLFTNHEMNIVNSARPPTPSIRSFTCFDRKTTLIYDVAQYFHSFALLRVLNLPGCRLMEFPPGIALLVHLRYLSIGHSYFPSPICNLWSLQTLIIRTTYSCMVLPSNISNLVNLKHLWSDTELYLPSINKPMNLDSISHVMLGDGVENFQECFPIIKKLACTLDTDTENDFESLRYLQTLKLTGSGSRRTESTQSDSLRAEPNCGNNHIRFPTTLKKLTLVRCHLSWSNMTIIQSLPNLEALKLKDNAFEGILWETGEEQFQQLKFLKLENLNIKQWEASSTNFPCLKQLLVIQCNDLEAVPPEIGDIPTLEFIKVFSQTFSLFKSLEIIQREQKDAGNFELKINHNGRYLSSYSTKHDETCSFYESDEG